MTSSFLSIVTSVVVVLCIIMLLRWRIRVRAHQSNKENKELENKIKHASQVVAAFGGTLESRSSRALLLYPQSELPYPKTEIRESIEFLLLCTCDIDRRNHLEVANISLNDYIPDDEYRSISEQQAGMTRAFELLKDGNRDGKRLAKLIVDSSTPAAQATLEQIQQRILRDGEMTIARHRTLRAVVEAMTPQREDSREG